MKSSTLVSSLHFFLAPKENLISDLAGCELSGGGDEWSEVLSSGGGSGGGSIDAWKLSEELQGCFKLSSLFFSPTFDMPTFLLIDLNENEYGLFLAETLPLLLDVTFGLESVEVNVLIVVARVFPLLDKSKVVVEKLSTGLKPPADVDLKPLSWFWANEDVNPTLARSALIPVEPLKHDSDDVVILLKIY